MIGQTISQYEVLAKLGGGGMGIVYKARDTKLDRTVALKFLPSYLSADDEAKERFVQEAKAASALDHTNICTIYDIAETEKGELYIVMGYYDGQTLKARLSEGALPIELALDVARQLARALERAHEAGIVHRDIKPANIMLTERGEVKLLDFGLAKLAGGVDLTKTGSTLGTASYMSPEQVRGDAAGPASDIWSFGVVMHEMLTGKVPFEGTYEQAISYAILNEDPPPVQDERQDVPDEIAEVVGRCLAKEPGSRYASMADLLGALGQSEETRTVVGAPASRHGSRRKGLYVGSAVAAVVVAATFLLWNRGPLESGRADLNFEISPLTRHAGNERWPSISPDGNQVAYSWNGPNGDNYDIYVGVIGQESFVRLTEDPAAETAPHWSPDARSLSFLRCDEMGGVWMTSCSIHVMTALGGSERRVGDLMSTRSRPRWHPSGEWLIVSESRELSAPTALFAMSLQTGKKIALTDPPNSLTAYGDDVVDVLPDGSGVVFYRAVSFGVADLYVLPLSSNAEPDGEPRLIVSSVDGWAGGVMAGAVVAGEGDEVLFAGDEALWWVSVHGDSEPERVLRTGHIGAMDIDRERTRIVLDRPGSSFLPVVWRLTLSGESSLPRPLLAWTASSFNAQYSPDGLRAAFSSDRSGSWQIWIATADGTGPRQLTSFGDAGIAGSPGWSPDGQEIVFDARPDGNGDILVISADGGTPRQLTAHPADDIVPSWSPGGEWIYFSSRRTGTDQIWKMKTDGTGAIQVTHGGGFHAKESSDGEYLYYSKANTIPAELWRVRLVAGGEEELVHQTMASWRAFDATDDGVFVLPHRDQEGLMIQRVSRDLSEPSVVYQLPPESGFRLGLNGALSVSPDASSVLVLRTIPAEFDLDQIEGIR